MDYKKTQMKTIASGMIVCLAVLLSSLYILFKTGASVVIDTVLLSILILSILQAFQSAHVLVSDVFARTCVSCAITIASYFVVFYLFDVSLTPMQIVLFGVVTIIFAYIGVLFFTEITPMLTKDDDCSFPTLKPRIELLKCKDNKKEDNNVLIKSIIGSSLYSALMKSNILLPGTIQLHPMLVLDNSLVLISSGYFIGYQTYLKMIIGFLYSLLIFSIFGAVQFSEHVLNPYLYSVILGLSIMQGFLTLKSILVNFKLKSMEELSVGFKHNKTLIYIASMFLMFGILSLIGIIHIPIWLYLVLLPVSVMLSTSTFIGTAKTGFWISSLEDILPIFIILITQTTDLYAIILTVSAFTAFEFCGIYSVFNAQVAVHFQFPIKKVKVISFISIVFTVVVTLLLIVFVFQPMGFGSSALPTPSSQIFGMTIQGYIDSLTTLQLPPYINPYIFVASGVLGYFINKKYFSPMLIVAGMVLPFGTFLVMGMGAFLSYYLEKRKVNRTSILFSGLSVGDGLVSTLIAFLQTL